MGFSIYFAEQAVTDSEFRRDEVMSSHAYLALAEEHMVRPPIVREEIHFKNEGFLRLRHHRFYTPDRPAQPFKRSDLYGHIGGKWCDIKPVWDDAVQFSKLIETLDIPFCGYGLKESYNCRSGAMVVLRQMGFDYHASKRVVSNSGTRSDLWEFIQQKMEHRKL